MAHDPVCKDGQVLVSWYGPGFHGKRTSSGEYFNQNAATVAHKTLPFGTWVEFTDPITGIKKRGRVNDRGPYVGHREYDLSKYLGTELGVRGPGRKCLEAKVLKG